MFNFYGRLSRMGFFIRLCAVGVLYYIGVLLYLLSGAKDGINLLLLPFLFLGSLFLLLCFVSLWGATVRRLHDMNLSGWWCILVYLFPLCLVVLCLWPGTPGRNRYGLIK